MKKGAIGMLGAFIVSFMMTMNASACTDVRVIANDKTVIIARSMEFAMDLQSTLRSSNRNRLFTMTTPDNKPGLTWKAKYGYLFVDGLDQDFAVDGMNEQGLSFEYLYLPGETQYQTIPAGKENQAVPYYHFGDWVLSNFKTVDEVRQALSSVYFFEKTLPVAGNIIFPLHAAIYDASGKGIIVEFVNGNMNVFDSIGILTNSPTYDWQVVALRNYLNLSPYDPKPIVINGITYAATGQGTGMLGLPGDISPPSRFTKMAFMSHVSYPVPDAVSGLNLAQHLLNNVDIPIGLSRATTNGKELAELTQWVVFKDLSHKMFYYRTYHDMTIRGVTMSKLDFSEHAARLKMPLESPVPYTMDMTATLMNRK